MFDELTDYIKNLVMTLRLTEPSTQTKVNDSFHYLEVRSRGLVPFQIRRNMTELTLTFTFEKDEEAMFNQLDEIVQRIDSARCTYMRNSWDLNWNWKPTYSFKLRPGTKRETTKFMRNLIK